ncbi:MAG TPA: ArsA-related P-loop ATPase [Acidimicrobiia bacterium]|nr:ArsA-related P-loop ATPase [Acidimicrobiia bacterium]
MRLGAGPAPVAPLAAIVENRHVVVCCGTGGVGKTTTAAVFAIEAAKRGRNAVVVTIDPAKRLADTLGVDTLGHAVQEIDRRRWDPDGRAPRAGRLSAVMLDTETTFDGLVVRYAKDEEQVQRILENRFYRNIAGALSGTQEYMAMEKLHELHEDGGYDLIVVDTPPTRHALDFLDAPNRLIRLLDNRVFRLLMMPTRAYLRVASAAVQAFLRRVTKVVGAEVVDDVVAFFRAFEGMEQGFRDRAAAVEQLLGDPTTAFVLVTAARRDAVDEAEFFADRLAESGLGVAALVVNRMLPAFASEEAVPGLRARAASLRSAKIADERGAAAARRLASRYDDLADFAAFAARERSELAGVAARLDTDVVAYVAELPHDVHDFAALAEVARHLFAPPVSG